MFKCHQNVDKSVYLGQKQLSKQEKHQVKLRKIANKKKHTKGKRDALDQYLTTGAAHLLQRADTLKTMVVLEQKKQSVDLVDDLTLLFTGCVM